MPSTLRRLDVSQLKLRLWDEERAACLLWVSLGRLMHFAEAAVDRKEVNLRIIETFNLQNFLEHEQIAHVLLDYLREARGVCRISHEAVDAELREALLHVKDIFFVLWRVLLPLSPHVGR